MSTCPGCGLELPAAGGPTHPYIGASPECWTLYGTVLARAYEQRDTLQLVVDAYACQHPGTEIRKTAQSVALHLATLCLFLEAGVDPRGGSGLHQSMVGRIPFHWLEPPATRGRLTVADADDPWAWARDVWAAWSAHHATVREWARPWWPGPRGAAPG